VLGGDVLRSSVLPVKTPPEIVQSISQTSMAVSQTLLNLVADTVACICSRG
jgi:hypothetical protein